MVQAGGFAPTWQFLNALLLTQACLVKDFSFHSGFFCSEGTMLFTMSLPLAFPSTSRGVCGLTISTPNACGGSASGSLCRVKTVGTLQHKQIILVVHHAAFLL